MGRDPRRLRQKIKIKDMKTKKITTLMFAALLAFLPLIGCSKDQPADEPTQQDVVYQFKVADLQGDSVSLTTYKGQVMLILNSATQCGYTPQYTDLQKIYEDFQDQGFIILDFPCNQFNGQAPGSNEDIHEFCTSRYGITFPQMGKINVNGASASPLFKWLKEKTDGKDIQWNFTKFLIDRDGNVVQRFEPAMSMTSVRNAIQKQL